ncbi:MAG: archaellin/type IV pilin N-terminal domain-containing protein [Nanoarchaeota archaeon]
MEKLSKKGVSEVISSVLLIAIVITSVVLVSAFVLPFLRESLQKGKSCLDIREQIFIDTESGYTCYVKAPAIPGAIANTSVMIKRGENEISGFLISFVKDGSSKTYTIKNNTPLSGVKMFNQQSTLILPQKSGAETYVFDNFAFERVELAAITADGEICQSFSAQISECFYP